jgi:hypothetical protein
MVCGTFFFLLEINAKLVSVVGLNYKSLHVVSKNELKAP